MRRARAAGIMRAMSANHRPHRAPSRDAHHVHDVVVVGAGPAGSTLATLLARGGADVLVLEKDHFPRFHIGESLLPMGCAVLERLGVEPDARVFVPKAGAEFVCEATGRRQNFSFEEALPGPPRSAWHVERATFDVALRDGAARAGAEVRHGEKVRAFSIDDDRARVVTDSGEVHARYFVDATGQDRLIARKARAVVPFEGLGKAAVFAHFDGISAEAQAEIGPGNEIRILVRRPGGWGWVIPLPGARLSVGIVTQAQGVDEGLFDAAFGDSPLVRGWTAGAARSATQVIRNFSYKNGAPRGARYAAIGDASCFLDPVFSSGVTLALLSAEQLAARLGPALAAGAEADPELAAPGAAYMERGYTTFGALIDRFYNSRFADTVFLTDSQDSPTRRGVVSLLAGDAWRDDNPFQDMLLRARRRPAPAVTAET